MPSWLSEQLTPSRVVPVVLTIITAGVTAVTGWLAANNFNLDPAIVTGIVAPIALGGLATALNWQKGWQQYEARGAANSALVEQYDVHPEDYVPDPDDPTSERAKAREEELMERPPGQPEPRPSEPPAGQGKPRSHHKKAS